MAALLFADATTVPLRRLKGDAGVPGRLLSVGLLLTLVLGAVVAMLVVPGLTWAEAALIAAVLAPTDAALGMAVVTDKAVPVRIRRALNIESGLNDGIATPFVTVFLAVVVGEIASEGGSPVLDALVQIAIAIVVAIVVGGVGGRLLVWSTQRGWSSHTTRQLFVLALAFVAYVGAVELGGNGFVSAFVAGLVFGAVDEGNRKAITFTEDVAMFASLLVWTVFGAFFVGPVLAGGFAASSVVYAVLSLTLIRMAPVAVALLGEGFRPLTMGFMGWFGPRGLASVVFTLIAVEDLQGARSTRRCSRWPPGRSSCRSCCTGSPRARSPRRTAPGSTRAGRPAGARRCARAPRAAPSATDKHRGVELTWTRTEHRAGSAAEVGARHRGDAHLQAFVAPLRPHRRNRARSNPRAAGDGVRRARRGPAGQRAVHDDRLSSWGTRCSAPPGSWCWGLTLPWRP